MDNTLNQFIKRGIQFEIFDRVLGTVCHNMLSPLSTTSLCATMIAKKLKLNILDEKVLQNVDILEKQLIACSVSINRIRIWDKDNEEMANIVEVVSMALELMRISLSLRNINVNFTKSSEIIVVTQQPFLYLILGILCFFVESLPEDSFISLDVIDHKEILFVLKSGKFQDEINQNSLDTNTLSINIASLHKLCENTSFDIAVEADKFKIKFN